MKKLLGLLSIALLGGAVSGCAYIPQTGQPTAGWLYTSQKASVMWTEGASASPPRTGTASTQNILGLVATGDASVPTAARNGGISTVHGVDYEYNNILFIIQDYTVIVHGE